MAIKKNAFSRKLEMEKYLYEFIYIIFKYFFDGLYNV